MKKTLFFIAAALATASVGAAAFAGHPDGRFSRYDKDGDGKIAVSEIDAHKKDFAARADADGDGYITKEEMSAMHEARKAEHEARRFPDANNDGVVDRREFEDAAREHFAKLDSDGNGLISKEEMAERRGHRRGH